MQALTVVELHMTVTREPVSVLAKISFATTFVAVYAISCDHSGEAHTLVSPVPGYKSKMITSFPVAPETAYLSKIW